VRVTYVERAVGRDRQIVWLIEFIGADGGEVGLRRGFAAFDHEHIVLVEIGDVHPPRAIKANAVADASGITCSGHRCEKLELRGASRKFTDRSVPVKIDDVKVIICIHRGAFDAVGEFF
jgi:hypothetical protein